MFVLAEKSKTHSTCRLLALDLTEDALTTGCWYNMSLAYDKHDENRVTLLESPMDMDESEILELCETRISSDGRLQVAFQIGSMYSLRLQVFRLPQRSPQGA